MNVTPNGVSVEDPRARRNRLDRERRARRIAEDRQVDSNGAEIEGLRARRNRLDRERRARRIAEQRREDIAVSYYTIQSFHKKNLSGLIAVIFN